MSEAAARSRCRSFETANAVPAMAGTLKMPFRLIGVAQPFLGLADRGGSSGLRCDQQRPS